MQNTKQNNSKLFIISPAPFLRSRESTQKIMRSVALALIPAGAAGVFIFGVNSLWVILASLISAVATQSILEKVIKRPACALDGSAIITGLLLAYNLPPNAPLWIPVIGSAFAISIAKVCFGGLGQNIFNPALAGRAFLLASWPTIMTAWQNPRWQPDAISSATPLAVVKHKLAQQLPSYMDLFLGNRPGCIGEVCVIAILIGALFLIYKRYISAYLPLIYIATAALLSWAFMGDGLFKGDWLFFILSGGLFLGAFFMATDYVTTPLTSKGKIIFGLGCGALTFAIRKFSAFPEGVSYSILIMNAATPIIDRYTIEKKFGGS